MKLQKVHQLFNLNETDTLSDNLLANASNEDVLKFDGSNSLTVDSKEFPPHTKSKLNSNIPNSSESELKKSRTLSFE